jgi:hypothetical protein
VSIKPSAWIALQHLSKLPDLVDVAKYSHQVAEGASISRVRLRSQPDDPWTDVVRPPPELSGKLDWEIRRD